MPYVEGESLRDRLERERRLLLCGYGTGRAEAEREIERLLRNAREWNSAALGWAANHYGSAGRPDRSRELLRRLEEVGRRQCVEST